MAFKVEAVSQRCFGFGEGPIWDDRRKKLILVDCFDYSIVMFEPKTKEFLQKRILGLEDESTPYITVAVPWANTISDGTFTNENFLVAATSKIVKFNWNTEESELLFDLTINKSDGKAYSFDDAKCDSQGRFWSGSFMATNLGELGVEENAGEIHSFQRIQDQFRKTTHVGNYNIPNGMAWNKENTKLYFCDLSKKLINVYDFNEDEGTLGNGKILFDYNKNENVKGGPDGMVIDTSGNLWVACWKGGCIIKIDGSTGKLLETVNTPVGNTTSLCFGGDNYESLFVTTTSLELDKTPVSGSDAGKLFCVTSPKDNSFKGLQHYFAKM